MKNIYIFFIALLSFNGLSACSTTDKYHRHLNKYFATTIWYKYPVDKVKAGELNKHKPSGYNIIEHAKKLDRGLFDVLKVNGDPDYVSASNRNTLFLAYIERGIILHFFLNTGMAPEVTPYFKVCRLSKSLYSRFSEGDNNVDARSFKCPVA